MSIPLYEINLSNNIMKTILVNICGHDVTHDFNSGEVSTKRLLRLKNLFIKYLILKVEIQTIQILIIYKQLLIITNQK